MADEETTTGTEETPDTLAEEVGTAASEEGAGETSTAGSSADEAAPTAAAAPAEPQEVLEPTERRAASPAPEPAHAPEHGPGRAKVRQGIVVSDKADKTIVVRVDVTRRHRRYGKILRTSTKIHAHDERNDAGTGDTVRVVECRPMSRTKRWRLTDVLEKAK